MQIEAFEIPIALFVFNRPHTTRRVFEAISKIKPSTLLLVADGPRFGKRGEAEACQQVRDIISRVDWPSNVSTNFSVSNLGCRERMISGLDWVFSQVEEAIILEDDCLPDLSFFPFCKELLGRYRGDSRVAYISGANLVESHRKTNDSYFFSQFGGIWGWATWRSEWQRYDRDLKDWPQLKKERKLEELFEEPRTVAYWTNVFDSMYEHKGPDTWDYQWQYTCLKNNSLTAVSSVNLIENIGFGQDATHTTLEDKRLILSTREVEFPLRHPASFIPLRSLDRLLQNLRTVPISQRIWTKMEHIFNRLIGRRV